MKRTDQVGMTCCGEYIQPQLVGTGTELDLAAHVLWVCQKCKTGMAQYLGKVDTGLAIKIEWVENEIEDSERVQTMWIYGRKSDGCGSAG